MALSEQSTQLLKAHLERCTAMVLRDGVPKGTAFFIDDHTLITCDHVVAPGGTYEVWAFQGERRDVVGVDHAVEPDLAVLTAATASEPQPSVCLDVQVTGSAHFLAGYPKAAQHPAGLESLDVAAHPRKDNEDGSVQLLRIEAGSAITYGHSGSALVNAASGAVVAVVRESQDVAGALGGTAVPISAAVEAFADVRRVHDSPPSTIARWRDIVGIEGWADLGKPWDLEERVDLTVSGDVSCWHIEVDTPGRSPHQRTGEELGRDLGVDVSTAMFRWAQRRRLRSSDEVELLGRLLAGALFPPAVAQHFARLGDADKIRLCLHIAAGNKLADIPWELAAVPGENGRFLAADEQFRFLRVLDEPKDSYRRARPQGEPIPVLGVVARPERWVFPLTPGQPQRQPPGSGEISEKLRTALGAQGYKATILENPMPSTLRDELAAATYDVFHYIGVGRLRGRKEQAQLSVVDDEGEPGWEDARKILDWADASGVRVLVLELTLPPLDEDLDPVPGSAVIDLARGRFEAVVTTGYPIHPRQLAVLNTEMYRALAKGKTVDRAVQDGRCSLQSNNIMQDAAGFACFSVATSPRIEVRLVTPPPRSSRTRGTTQREDVLRDRSVVQDRSEVDDEFSG